MGLAMLVLLCLSFRVEAASSPAAPCFALSDELLSIAQAERQLSWDCSSTGMQGGGKVLWLRFTQWDRAQPPDLFTTAITKFAGARLAALDSDGNLRVRHYQPADASPVLATSLFSLDLPEATDRTEAYVVAIERPHALNLAEEAALVRALPGGAPQIAIILVAVAAGMLLMPILFDLLFFLVLRERFVLLHAGMTAAGLVWVLTLGGLVTAFVVLPVPLLAMISELAFVLNAGLMGFFIITFLEEEALPRLARRVLKAVSGLMMLVGGCSALRLDVLQGVDGALYHLSFLPLLPTYLAAILWAIWRGSRAARFVAAAWLPILFAVSERTMREAGLHNASPFADQMVFFALGLEVIIIALGVADRFLSIRRERDQAITKAKTMKMLSERDSLTGLFNRRMIEERYALLRQEGFGTMAVIDLDHFKRINDTFGHARGDEVLRVVGRALAPSDEDMMAFRMGGEEFLVLLRGADSVDRAERRRQEIARTLAREDLGCLVTASMGIVEVTGGALPGASFAAVYARADRLLYQAKASGRNRMVCERIRVFHPRRRERRAAA